MNENKSLIKKNRTGRVDQEKLHLLRLINSSITRNDFNTIDDDFIGRIYDLVLKIDAGYIERLVHYCREELRPSKHAVILISALAQRKENTERTCKLLHEIIKSPEEKDEFISYYRRYIGNNGNSDLPAKLKTCLKKLTFKSTTDISRKSDSGAGHVQIHEVITSRQQPDKTPDSIRLKNKKKLEEIIKSDHLNYRELLNYLPEVVQSASDTNTVLQVITKISDKSTIGSSGVMPLDILDAYRIIESIDSIYSPSIMRSLEKALFYCISGMNYAEGFDEAFFIMDYTADMYMHRPGTQTTYIETAVLVKKILLKNENFPLQRIIQTYLNDTYKPDILNEIDNESKLNEICPAFSCIEHIWNLILRRTKYDQVFIFTSNKNWKEVPSLKYISLVWKRYRKIAPHARLYIINMNNGNKITLNTAKNDVNYISGFDHSIFQLIQHTQTKQYKQKKA